MILEINESKGGVAQMVERSLSMREVPGSMPGASKLVFFSFSFPFFSKLSNEQIVPRKIQLAARSSLLNFVF